MKTADLGEKYVMKTYNRFPLTFESSSRKRAGVTSSPHQVSSEIGPLNKSSVSDVSSFWIKFQNFFIWFFPPFLNFDLQIFPLQKVL